MKSDYLSYMEVTELAEALPLPYRKLVYIAAGTGYRIGDLCAAKSGDYDPATHTLRIVEEKTGKLRSVTPTQIALTDILLCTWTVDKDKPLIRSFDGKPLTRKTAWRWIKKAWAGLHPYDARQISPHSLRKAYAVYRRKLGYTLGEVQRDLGHDNISTTILYYYADVIADPSLRAEAQNVTA